MEQRPEDLRGMDAGAAREYVFHHITALKLSEKRYRELDEEYAKWTGRAELARGRDAPDLAREAQAEAARAEACREALGAEIAELRGQIEGMRRQLPALAARERSLDPDLLEQELLIALGKNPGEEEPEGTAQTERGFAEMDAQAALESLKKKMGLDAASAAGPGAYHAAAANTAAEPAADPGREPV
jgi:hypothetical protein